MKRGRVIFSGTLIQNGPDFELRSGVCQTKFADKDISIIRGDIPLDDCCDVNATTTFSDEGLTIVNDFGKTVQEKGDISVEMQSICDFLAKPYVLHTGEWSASDLRGALLYSIDIGTLLNSGELVLNPNRVDPWYQKIKGYNLFRGTFVVRVTINSMPFQAGSLLGHFLPMVSAISNLNGAAYETMHNTNLTTMSQQPNFILKADMSSAVLEIPYISPTNWYCFTDGAAGAANNRFSWGKFYLRVLSEVRTGATQSVNIPYTIYGYWRDVELAAPLVPNMQGALPRSRNIRSLAKKKGIKSTVSKEMEDTQGPVSKILSKVSVASGYLSSVPLLAPVMGPVSWASNIASGVASAFGWSKPMITTASEPMSSQYDRYMATSDGVKSAYPLALIHNNSIELTDAYTPRVEDEMSFQYLKTVSAYISALNWSTDAATGTQLYSKAMTPFDMASTGSKTSGALTVNYSTGPPAFYLSRGFKMWRGSMKVKLMFVKTQYHTGRLEITWSPSSVGGTPSNIFDSLYSMREIVDLRNTDEIEFTLPYMSEYNFLVDDNLWRYSGTFVIRVLNELRAPDTVASGVDVLIFMSGGDDLQFAMPVYTNPTESKRCQAFDPQMMGGSAIKNEHESSNVIGNVAMTHGGLSVTTKSVGEEFTSVKQILNRTNSVCNSDSVAICRINPWFVDTTSVSGGALSNPGNGGDAFSYIAKMYAFFRGGMVMTAAVSANRTPEPWSGPFAGAVVMNTGQTGFFNTAFSTQWPTSYRSFNGPISAAPVTSFGGISFAQCNTDTVSYSVPYYCATPASLVVPLRAANSIVGPTQPLALLEFNPGYASNTACEFGRSVSDDFQFSYFVGCPPVYDS